MAWYPKAWLTQVRLAVEEGTLLPWSGSPGQVQVCGGEPWTGETQLPWLSTTCAVLQRLVMEEGDIVSLTWLPRASMTLQRPAMADGGAVSVNWLLRDCLVLRRPAVVVASPAWIPREWPALEKSTMEEGHSFPSLALQSIPTPGEASYGRAEHSYTHLAFVLSGHLEANRGRGGEKLPQTGSSVPVQPCTGQSWNRVSQFPQPVSQVIFSLGEASLGRGEHSVSAWPPNAWLALGMPLGIGGCRVLTWLPQALPALKRSVGE